MAAVPPPPEPQVPITFRFVVTDVLRFGVNQATVLIDEGYDSLEELRFWDYDDISKWAANKGKLPLNRGGCVYGDPRVRNLQAFAFYATDMHRRGLPLSLRDFDGNMLLKYKEMVRVDRAKKVLKSEVAMPPSLERDTVWEDWENSLINYLQSRRGIDNIPLSYVIRSNDRPDRVDDENEDLTRYLDLVYNAPFDGPAFSEDNANVFGILESLTLGHDSANWINRRTRQTRDGRQAMLDLKHHFDGGEQKYKRKQVALSRLELLHYKHEKMMDFHTFSTKLKKCFDTIEITDQGYSETTKIDILLRKMKSNSHELRNVATLIRQDPDRYDTFDKATQEFAKFIAFLFPEGNVGDGNGSHHRKRRHANGADSNKHGKGGHNGNKGRGHKIVRKGGKQFCNGVDVTDQTRTFNPDEWRKLPYSFKTELYNNPERKSKKPKRDTSSSTTTGTEQSTLATDDTIGRIVSGVMRAQISNNDNSSSSGAPARQPRMGAGGAATRQAAAADSSSVGASVLTENTRWDHNGNRI